MNNREILAKEMADLKAKEVKIRAKRKQIRQKEMISLAKLYCKKEGFKTPAEALDFLENFATEPQLAIRVFNIFIIYLTKNRKLVITSHCV